MINFFKKQKVRKDENEDFLEKRFSFLLDDYGFQLRKIDLGNAVDADGKFFFYGPLYSYCIFNEHVCINILYLVQRQDYEIYITDSFQDSQVFIRNGTSVPNSLAYNLTEFAFEIKDSVISTGEIYGRKI